jgi:hypothetical protein
MRYQSSFFSVLCYNGTFVLKINPTWRQKNLFSMKIWTFLVFLFYHMQTFKVSPLIYFVLSSQIHHHKNWIGQILVIYLDKK